jgi:DNA-directed RNA polymerase specialized sigma24 family protein
MSKVNEALSMLAQHHEEYIKMAKAIAGNHHSVMNYAEDYVQDAYLRLARYEDLYEKVIKDGKVQKGYMFFVLRSIVLNNIKKKSVLDYNFLGDQYDFEEVYMHIDKPMDPKDAAKNVLETKIYTLLKEKAEWFDYELFRKYMESGKSYKDLAAESKLGQRTIFLSIKRCKLLIAEHLFEDYIDLKNGDFDKIVFDIL